MEHLDRFTNRAGYYARHRPGYPDEVIRILEQQGIWTPRSIIADIGAGTGISSELFLRHGNQVWAIEPNADMRAHAAALASRYPGFQVLEGPPKARACPTQRPTSWSPPLPFIGLMSIAAGLSFAEF
jgi:hypothetical protein